MEDWEIHPYKFVLTTEYDVDRFLSFFVRSQEHEEEFYAMIDESDVFVRYYGKYMDITHSKLAYDSWEEEVFLIDDTEVFWSWMKGSPHSNHIWKNILNGKVKLGEIK